MNLRTFLIAGVSALFGLCLAGVIVGYTSAQFQSGDLIDDTKPVEGQAAMPMPGVGRYQAVSHGDYLWLIDTATGEGWRADPAADRSHAAKWLQAIKPKP
jgi:hypothetical protein